MMNYDRPSVREIFNWVVDDVGFEVPAQKYVAMLLSFRISTAEDGEIQYVEDDFSASSMIPIDELRPIITALERRMVIKCDLNDERTHGIIKFCRWISDEELRIERLKIVANRIIAAQQKRKKN